MVPHTCKGDSELRSHDLHTSNVPATGLGRAGMGLPLPQQVKDRGFLDKVNLGMWVDPLQAHCSLLSFEHRAKAPRAGGGGEGAAPGTEWGRGHAPGGPQCFFLFEILSF